MVIYIVHINIIPCLIFFHLNFLLITQYKNSHPREICISIYYSCIGSVLTVGLNCAVSCAFSFICKYVQRLNIDDRDCYGNGSIMPTGYFVLMCDYSFSKGKLFLCHSEQLRVMYSQSHYQLKILVFRLI